MKSKLFIPILLLIFSLALVNCSSEPTTLSSEALNMPMEADSTSRTVYSPCDTVGSLPPPCDPNFNFPIQYGGGTPLVINYDPSLTEEEVICIRYQYFQCFDYLRMANLQNSDIHQDFWRTSGKPDDDIIDTANEDPRVGIDGD